MNKIYVIEWFNPKSRDWKFVFDKQTNIALSFRLRASAERRMKSAAKTPGKYRIATYVRLEKLWAQQ